jgi:hypothetical protein
LADSKNPTPDAYHDPQEPSWMEGWNPDTATSDPETPRPDSAPMNVLDLDFDLDIPLPTPPPSATKVGQLRDRSLPEEEIATHDHIRTLLDQMDHRLATTLDKSATHAAKTINTIVGQTREETQNLEKHLLSLSAKASEIADRLSDLHTQTRESENSLATNIETRLQKATTEIGKSTSALRSQVHQLRLKIWIGSALLSLIASASLILLLTTIRPGWILTEQQQTLISAGTILITRYHEANEPRKEAIEKLMGWQSKAAMEDNP